jgi:hypothetical protein
MLKLNPQRKVKLITVERPTAWLVVAFLTETRGDETVIISGPKVVKVILKQSKALVGAQKANVVLALPAPKGVEKIIEVLIPSPYVSSIFGYSNSDVVIGLAARPPTFL